MSSYCPKCYVKKVLIEENTLACPKCDVNPGETPQLCDYCRARVASTPSDHGTWICDVCIRQAITVESRVRTAPGLKDAPEVNAHAS